MNIASDDVTVQQSPQQFLQHTPMTAPKWLLKYILGGSVLGIIVGVICYASLAVINFFNCVWVTLIHSYFCDETPLYAGSIVFGVATIIFVVNIFTGYKRHPSALDNKKQVSTTIELIVLIASALLAYLVNIPLWITTGKSNTTYFLFSFLSLRLFLSISSAAYLAVKLYHLLARRDNFLSLIRRPLIWLSIFVIFVLVISLYWTSTQESGVKNELNKLKVINIRSNIISSREVEISADLLPSPIKHDYLINAVLNEKTSKGPLLKYKKGCPSFLNLGYTQKVSLLKENTNLKLRLIPLSSELDGTINTFIKGTTCTYDLYLNFFSRDLTSMNTEKKMTETISLSW